MPRDIRVRFRPTLVTPQIRGGFPTLGVLIIGTATDGPTNEPVIVRGLEEAQEIFGNLGEGTLLEGYHEFITGASRGADLRTVVGLMRLDFGEYASVELPEPSTGTGLSEPMGATALTIRARYKGEIYNMFTISYKAVAGGFAVSIVVPAEKDPSGKSQEYVLLCDPSGSNTELINNLTELANAINHHPVLARWLYAEVNLLDSRYSTYISNGFYSGAGESFNAWGVGYNDTDKVIDFVSRFSGSPSSDVLDSGGDDTLGQYHPYTIFGTTPVNVRATSLDNIQNIRNFGKLALYDVSVDANTKIANLGVYPLIQTKAGATKFYPISAYNDYDDDGMYIDVPNYLRNWDTPATAKYLIPGRFPVSEAVFYMDVILNPSGASGDVNYVETNMFLPVDVYGDVSLANLINASSVSDTRRFSYKWIIQTEAGTVYDSGASTYTGWMLPLFHSPMSSIGGLILFHQKDGSPVDELDTIFGSWKYLYLGVPSQVGGSAPDWYSTTPDAATLKLIDTGDSEKVHIGLGPASAFFTKTDVTSHYGNETSPDENYTNAINTDVKDFDGSYSGNEFKLYYSTDGSSWHEIPLYYEYDGKYCSGLTLEWTFNGQTDLAALTDLNTFKIKFFDGITWSSEDDPEIKEIQSKYPFLEVAKDTSTGEYYLVIAAGTRIRLTGYTPKVMLKYLPSRAALNDWYEYTVYQDRIEFGTPYPYTIKFKVHYLKEFVENVDYIYDSAQGTFQMLDSELIPPDKLTLLYMDYQFEPEWFDTSRIYTLSGGSSGFERARPLEYYAKFRTALQAISTDDRFDIIVPKGAYIDTVDEVYDASISSTTYVNVGYVDLFDEFTQKRADDGNPTIVILAAEPYKPETAIVGYTREGIANWVTRMTDTTSIDPRSPAGLIASVTDNPMMCVTVVPIALIAPGGAYYISDGAAFLAGLAARFHYVPRTAANESLYNLALPNGVRPAFRLSESQVDALLNMRYIVFHMGQDGAPRLMRDTTLAQPFSSLSALTHLAVLLRIKQGFIRRLRPHIGKIVNAQTKMEVDAAITSELALWQKSGIIQQAIVDIDWASLEGTLGVLPVHITIVRSPILKGVEIDIVVR